MADTVTPMNAPDPAEDLQRPKLAVPSLTAASKERQSGQSVAVLQRIRSWQPRSSRYPDAVFRVAIAISAISVFAVVVLVAWELIDKSKLSLHQFGLSFFYGHEWDPVNGDFGAMPFIYGTLVSSFLALL